MLSKVECLNSSDYLILSNFWAERIFWGGRGQVQSEFRERASHIWKHAFRNSCWLPAAHFLRRMCVQMPCQDRAWGYNFSFLRKFSFMGWGGQDHNVHCVCRGLNPPLHFPTVSLVMSVLELITNSLSSQRHWLLWSASPSVVNWRSLPLYYVFRITYSLHHWLWMDQGYIRSYVSYLTKCIGKGIF